MLPGTGQLEAGQGEPREATATAHPLAPFHLLAQVPVSAVPVGHARVDLRAEAAQWLCHGQQSLGWAHAFVINDAQPSIHLMNAEKCL